MSRQISGEGGMMGIGRCREGLIQCDGVVRQANICPWPETVAEATEDRIDKCGIWMVYKVLPQGINIDWGYNAEKIWV